MALNKSIETDIGVAATYWHIHRIEIDRDEGRAVVCYRGFASEAARRSGADAIMFKRQELPLASVCTAEIDALMKGAYGAAKAGVVSGTDERTDIKNVPVTTMTAGQPLTRTERQVTMQPSPRVDDFFNGSADA